MAVLSNRICQASNSHQFIMEPQTFEAGACQKPLCPLFLNFFADATSVVSRGESWVEVQPDGVHRSPKKVCFI